MIMKKDKCYIKRHTTSWTSSSSWSGITSSERNGPGTRCLFTQGWMAASGEVSASMIVINVVAIYIATYQHHHQCHYHRHCHCNHIIIVTLVEVWIIGIILRYEGSMFSGSGYHSGMMPGNMSSMSRPGTGPGSTLQRGQVHTFPISIFHSQLPMFPLHSNISLSTSKVYF